MKRRTFIQSGLAATLGAPLLAALKQERFDKAAEVLAQATAKGQVAAAVLHVTQGKTTYNRWFGKAQSEQAMFLLGSISKPICMTALMMLFDQGKFGLDDPLKKFIAKFTGEGRDQVTLRHLLSHVSGLPDQLPENDALRKKHAGLDEFVEQAIRTPRLFAPASKYQYSSMAILLAARVAELVSGVGILELVAKAVLKPLGMQHSAIGLGRFKIEDLLACQTEYAAPEAGAGDPNAKDWDWNSPYWRKLGAPWGGVHASAPDVGRFLAEFLYTQGKVVKPETAKLMLKNHNAAGQTQRGLGLNIGSAAGSPGCSESTFGHSGSTGTLAWADPASDTICVVLTTLPSRAVKPHPVNLAAEQVSKAVR